MSTDAKKRKKSVADAKMTTSKAEPLAFTSPSFPFSGKEGLSLYFFAKRIYKMV